MRVAVIGVGKVSVDNYLPFLAEQPDVSLGAWNRSPDAARDAMRKFGGTAFESLDDLIAWKPDIAFVVNSERARVEIVTRLIESGVPRIFMEKPLTAARGQENVDEADFVAARTLVRLAEERGCELAINFNYRFFTMTQLALARAAVSGALASVTARAHFACWSHTLDLISLFAGPIKRVSAISGSVERSSHGMTGPDLAVSFECESGVIGGVVASLNGPWEHSLLDISLDYAQARLRIYDLDGGLDIQPEGSPIVEHLRLGSDISRWDRYAASFRSSVGAYLESVRHNSPPPIPAVHGLRELQLEASIRRAVSTGAVVDVQQEFSL